VRTVAECVEEATKDVTVMTKPLEARQLAGNRGLFARFDRATEECLDPQAFFKAKRLETGATPYQIPGQALTCLEAQSEGSTGGLRDLQVILWISHACGLGNSWKELARRGLITPEEARQAHRHHRFAPELRVRLHYAAARREDRLLFDYQESPGAGARLLPYRAPARRRAVDADLLPHGEGRNPAHTILLQNMGTEIFPARNSDVAEISGKFRRVR